jgi:hypothetical protein
VQVDLSGRDGGKQQDDPTAAVAVVAVGVAGSALASGAPLTADWVKGGREEGEGKTTIVMVTLMTHAQSAPLLPHWLCIRALSMSPPYFPGSDRRWPDGATR